MKKSEYKSITAATKRLLQGQEDRDVDFKINPKAIDPEDFVAFANTRGGTILSGVEEQITKEGLQRGKVRGCKISDKIRQGIISTANSCRPSIDISVQVENSTTTRPILRIDINEGADKPYATSSGLYKMRADGQNIGIDPAMMKALILERESDQFVSRFRHAADDLMDELLKIHFFLSGQIGQLQKTTQQAIEASTEAASAAQIATEAAIDATEAATAAEDAALTA